MEIAMSMFKHILIPTDGSELSKIAIQNGVQFAKESHAKITGITVTTPFHYSGRDAMQINDSLEQYGADAKVMADRNLAVLKEEANKAGVDCDLVHCSSEHPYEEIVKTAEARHCDVIFQASHGRRGVSALIWGSETQKVLTHSKIPVLVFR
jgi:nucleotide-binding universal stress UspA family protein